MQTRSMGPTRIFAYPGYHHVEFTFGSFPMLAYVPDRSAPVIHDRSGRAGFLCRVPFEPLLRLWIAQTYIDEGDGPVAPAPDDAAPAEMADA